MPTLTLVRLNLIMERLYEEDEVHLSLARARGAYSKISRKLRKSLIAAFGTNSNQTTNYKASILLSIFFSFVSAMQGIALVLQRHDDIAEYPHLDKVFAMISYSRLDTLAFDLDVIYEFFYVMIVVVYTPVGILVANVGLNIYCKRKPNWLSVKVMSLLLNLLEQVFLLPSLLLMLTIVKYSYISREETMFEYGDSTALLSSHGLSAASLVTLPVLLALLYINSYFFYDNMYAKRRKLVYSMRDSFVHRVHILARFGMVLCYVFLSSLSKVWYRFGILLLCGMMYLLFVNRLSYFDTLLNVENASKKVVIAWAVVSYFVGWSSDSASAIVIMLVFVSPVLVALIFFYIQEKTKLVGKVRNREITSEYQVELKLRMHLGELEGTKKDEQEQIHRNIEQLFNFATQNFSKCPLLPIWESLYYYHYRKDPFVALLKLSKVHISEPTLESQFFTNKIESKIAKEPSPERLYLRYLKLLDEAKRADESCCMQLVTACTELLGRKIDSKKFDTCVERLSRSIKRSAEKYFRILELFPDNEEVLNLLGSFMCDVMKNSEGKTFLTKANMLKSNDLRRGTSSSGLTSSSLFNDQNGLLVLSCCIQSPGEIILANAKAYEMFICTKIDLLGKSMQHFVPEEYAVIFSQTLNQLVLFGAFLGNIQQLFRLLLDSEGFLISANVNMKITTWDNKPHVLLILTPCEATERILLDSSLKVRAHTRLDILDRDLNTSYVGCALEEVLPDLAQRVRVGERDFLFHYGSTGGKFITVEDISFREISFTLLTLQHIFLSHHSTNASIGSMKRRESIKDPRKGVRFNAEGGGKMPDSKYEQLVTNDPGTTVVYSEAEARMKKKLDLTTSLTTSTTSTVSFEILETMKISRSLKRTKLLLMLSFLMLVAGLVATVIFVTSILESLKSITIIRDYSERNLNIIKLAYDIRSLMLSDSPLFSYDEQTVMARIQATSISLNRLADFMKSLVGKGNREADAYLTQQKVPMWMKIENDYEFRKMTLLDALYTYTTASSRLTSSDSPFTPLADSYFVFRNGASDLLEVSNMTLHIRVKSEETERKANLDIIEFLIYMCGMLIVLPLAFLVAPQFFLFEKQAKRIWSSIYTIPRETILEVRTTSVERLQNYFSNDIVIETPIVPKHVERSVSATRLWPGFSLKLGVYLFVNLVFFVVVEVVYFVPVDEIALTIPNYLFWMGLRPKLASESMFWSREKQLITYGSYSMSELIPEGEMWSHPEERIENTTAAISFVRKLVTFGDSRYGIRSIKKSDAYLSFLFTDSCAELSETDCGDLEASLGLTFALREWMNYIEYFRYQAIAPEDLFDALKAIEKKAESIVESTNYAMDFYQRDAISQIDAISSSLVQTAYRSAFLCRS